MSQSVLEMTKDLVLAQIQAGTLSPEDMQEALRHIYQNLTSLKSREVAEAPVAETPRVPADWRTSITRQAVTCLECGAQFRQLTGRHLRLHGLDARSYRRKFGIPQSQPLATRATIAKRRKIVSEVKPWEKSPTYMKGQEERAATTKKSARKKATRKG